MEFKACVLGVLLLASLAPSRARADAPANKIRVLIVDGMNNHDWARNTRILKAILEGTDRFAVDVSTSPPTTQPSEAHRVGQLAAQVQRLPGRRHELQRRIQFHGPASIGQVILRNHSKTTSATAAAW